jgi:hypothetical protein
MNFSSSRLGTVRSAACAGRPFLIECSSETAGGELPVLDQLLRRLEMHTSFTVSSIAHVIQLSVAPVFLLTAVGTILNVLANRLGRVIDRARVLESRLSGAGEKEQNELHWRLGTLSRRSKLINLAISLCTMCALLVCVTIAILFIGAFWEVDVSVVIGVLFIIAMLALIGGLIGFLREIYIAIASLQIGMR